MSLSLSELAALLLWASAAFSFAAFLGDAEATRQMSAERFRWVPVVRTLRGARLAASVAVLVFIGIATASSPLLSVLTLLVGCLVAMLGQAQRLTHGAVGKAFFGGFIPWLVTLFALVNLYLLPQQAFPGLQLSLTALLPAALTALLLALATRLRDEQDLLRLRD